MRALGLMMLLVPSMGWAQQAVLPAPLPAVDDGECTVTTTVRCTGAAAPYAVQAAQPQAPVVVQLPPPPVAVPPPPVAAPPVLFLDPRDIAGWRVSQGPDGRLWKERTRSTSSPGMWGTGLTIWVSTYVAGIVGGVAEGDFYGGMAAMPIIGSMVNAGLSNGATAQGLWVVDSLAQGTGFVLFLVGLAAGPEKLERVPLSVGPIGFVGGGSGAAVSARF